MKAKERVLAVHPQARLRFHGSNACRATYPQIWVGNHMIGEGHANDWSGQSAWRDAVARLPNAPEAAHESA